MKIMTVIYRNVDHRSTSTSEDAAYDLSCATVFSRIGLNKAFHQKELNEDIPPSLRWKCSV